MHCTHPFERPLPLANEHPGPCSEGLGSLLSGGTATIASGAALEAGLLAGSGALQAAGAALDAASAALAAELGGPLGGSGRRLAGAQWVGGCLANDQRQFRRSAQQ